MNFINKAFKYDILIDGLYTYNSSRNSQPDAQIPVTTKAYGYGKARGDSHSSLFFEGHVIPRLVGHPGRLMPSRSERESAPSYRLQVHL